MSESVIPFTIDSRALNGSTVTGTTSDITVYFPSPLNIYDAGGSTVPFLGNPSVLEVCLRAFKVVYSWHNIGVNSAGQVNNTLRYNNGSTWRNVTIPPGMYSTELLNEYLKKVMRGHGDYQASPEEYYLSIENNYSTGYVEITLTNSYQIDLSTSALNDLLGWTHAIHNHSGTQQGALRGNLTDDISALMIHCSIAKNSFLNNQASDIIHTFLPDTIPSGNIIGEVKNLLWVEANTSHVQSMRVYITDQSNRLINFHGEHCIFHLLLRKKPGL